MADDNLTGGSGAAPSSSAGASRLETLSAKYGYTPTSGRAQAHRSVDTLSAATYQVDRSRLAGYRQRMSGGPRTTSGETTTAALASEVAGIQLELAELVDTYGKLNVRFGDLVSKEGLYSVRDSVNYAGNWLMRNKKGMKKIRIEAAGRRGENIATLLDRMTEVLQDQHEEAVKGRDLALSLETETVAHMRHLDKKFIETLRGGYTTRADMAVAETEIQRLEGELAEIDSTLVAYESDIQRAKEANDLDKVGKLTDEMSQVLDMKYGVMDGKLGLEGTVSDIRREMLDSAEGTQSTKGASAASRVNLQALHALAESYSELEIKYRHAREDMIPVFKTQGRISVAGMRALDMKDTIKRVADISNRLMDANSRLVMHLAAETFDLLKTPIYDVDKAREKEAELRTYLADLNKLKLAWADNVQRVMEEPLVGGSHYGRRR